MYCNPEKTAKVTKTSQMVEIRLIFKSFPFACVSVIADEMS